MPIAQSHEFFIQLHLTERCNLRCRHCYQTGNESDELSFAGIKDLTTEVADMLKTWQETYDMKFSPSFNITGGEPFLREDLFDIISEIGNQGFEIYLLSNGILINKQKAEKLSALGVKGVQVSIEGPEKIHDSIRGKNSFASSIKGILYLLDSGIRVTLNVTLSKINAGYFMDLVTLASSLRVHKLGFSRLVPSGRGSGLLSKMLEKEKTKDIYEEIFSLNTYRPEIVTGDPVASQLSSIPDKDAGDVPSGGCAAGVSGLTILPDGTVTPCRRMPVQIGNVRRDSLREIWATSEVLEMLRDKSSYKGKCGKCKRWANCRGCRAIAYAHSQAKGKNDFLVEDPQCFIE